MLLTARILFVICGGFWVLIGVLTPPLMARRFGPPILFVTEATDTALFGSPPNEILDSDRNLATLRSILIHAMVGFMVVAGVLLIGVGWFGLRTPEAWALAVVTLAAVVAPAYWWITLGPYRRAGIRLPISAIPPFMWVPGILMPIAVVLGWIQYLRS